MTAAPRHRRPLANINGCARIPSKVGEASLPDRPKLWSGHEPFFGQPGCRGNHPVQGQAPMTGVKPRQCLRQPRDAGAGEAVDARLLGCERHCCGTVDGLDPTLRIAPQELATAEKTAICRVAHRQRKRRRHGGIGGVSPGLQDLRSDFGGVGGSRSDDTASRAAQSMRLVFHDVFPSSVRASAPGMFCSRVEHVADTVAEQVEAQGP
jgi:hypothetical protein